MPFFKDSENALHYLSDEDVNRGGEALLPSGCVEISDAEAQALRAPSRADTWAARCAAALQRLEKTGVTVERIAEAVALGLTTWTTADVVAFMTYRRNLRNFPKTDVSDTSKPLPELPTAPAFPAGT